MNLPKPAKPMGLPDFQKASILTGVSDGYDVIEYVDIPTPIITSPNEFIVKNKYAGVNYVEAFFRKGIYPVSKFPSTSGIEASGVVVAVGADVTRFAVGDNVAYFSPGTFAQYTKVVDTHTTISKLDPDVSEEEMKIYGSCLVTVITAISLIEESHKLERGQFALVWAAVGGVGSALTKFITARGGRVIAVTSSPEKTDLAKELGAEFVINRRTEDVLERVLEITNGVGVSAAYDSVGRDTFDISYDSLARKGTFVSYGSSSGDIGPVNFSSLPIKNIKFLKAAVYRYLVDYSEWEYYFNIVKKYVEDGLDLEVRYFPMRDYADAALILESGYTTGKLSLVIPQ